MRERAEEIVRRDQGPAEEPASGRRPPGIDPDEAFPADHVRAAPSAACATSASTRSTSSSSTSGRDEWVGRGSWLEAIEELKAEGKIRAFGISINDHQPANALKLVESGAVDTVQVIYNVFDQSPGGRAAARLRASTASACSPACRSTRAR